MPYLVRTTEDVYNARGKFVERKGYTVIVPDSKANVTYLVPSNADIIEETENSFTFKKYLSRGMHSVVGRRFTQVEDTEHSLDRYIDEPVKAFNMELEKAT